MIDLRCELAWPCHMVGAEILTVERRLAQKKSRDVLPCPGMPRFVYNAKVVKRHPFPSSGNISCRASSWSRYPDTTIAPDARRALARMELLREGPAVKR